MANQTTEEAIWDRDRLWWLLGIASFALVAGGTWYFRQLPWVTALSTLIFVSLCIAGAKGLLKLSPQKLWGVLLILAVGLYLGSLSYQAGEPARDTRYLAWATPQLPNSSENLILAIAYPLTVPVEAPDKPGRPLSVYLWPPVLPTTSTVTATSLSAISVLATPILPTQPTTPAATETSSARMPTSAAPTPIPAGPTWPPLPYNCSRSTPSALAILRASSKGIWLSR